MKQSHKAIIALLLGLITLILLRTKEPLTDVHWDAPIYMSQASRFDTAGLQYFATHAAEITREIPYTKPFSGDYHRFCRVGHITLLGSVVNVFGATNQAIQISTGLYAILMVLAVVMSTLTATTTIDLLGTSLPKPIVGYAAAFSALLYMASDIFGYLAGNLVSEVPALFLMSTGAWLLLKALQKRSLLLAAASGACVFLAYVVRIESPWNYVAFVIPLVSIMLSRARPHFCWQAFAVSAFSALVLYVLYAWAFYPLANPGTLLQFVTSLKNYNMVRRNGAVFLIITGGALWIGGMLSLRAFRASPVTHFSLGWLFLTILPWLPAVLLDRPVETRMLAFVMPPLLLASTLGWAMLFDTWGKHRLAAVMFVLLAVSTALVSNSLTYPLIQSLPGLWRVQYMRPFLAAREKSTYPINVLRDLSRAIYATTSPTIVSWDPKQIREEDLWIVQYFAPRDPGKIDTMMQKRQSTQNACDDKVPLPVIEPIVFCTMLNADVIRQAEAGSLRIIQLQAKLSGRGPSDLHLKAIPFDFRNNPK